MAYRKPPVQKRPLALGRGADGLTDWCRERMTHARTPRSARDLVNAWYDAWRGRQAKPPGMKAKAKGWFVDRVAAWLRHHTEAGRLRLVDRKGGAQAGRYLAVSGVNWRRGKRQARQPELGLGKAALASNPE